MKHLSIVRLAPLLAFGAAIAACSRATSNATSGAGMSPSTTSAASMSNAPWRALLDPQLSAWRGYKEAVPPAGWSVTDDVLSKKGSVNDLISRDEFQNFELAFDWKLEPGGNAGVFYRASEDAEKIYFTGPEYQLLDDARHPDGKSRLTAAGADYALYPSPAGIVKPANEWNSSRIVVIGNHVEHWLNGKKVVEYELGSADWETRLKASKFATWPKYGRIAAGHVGIQGDHEGPLAIRAMRIRTLP